MANSDNDMTHLGERKKFMDLTAATTTALADSATGLAQQVRALADREAIRALGALYSIAVDDHDLETVVRCFHPEGTFARGGVEHVGHEALREFYAQSMDRYTTTLHVPNSHLVEVHSAAGTAKGLLLGQAELALRGRLLMAAYRYHDRYVREQGRWVFSSRTLQFMYNVPFEEMGTSFGDRMRIRAPGAEARSGDYPETLPTWTSYRD